MLGAGSFLFWRPEVTTPANSLLQIREGVRLLQLNVSPYQGSNCRAAPLVLAILAPWAAVPVLYGLPNILCDYLAALVVERLAVSLTRKRTKPAGKLRLPGTAVVGKQATMHGLLLLYVLLLADVKMHDEMSRCS